MIPVGRTLPDLEIRGFIMSGKNTGLHQCRFCKGKGRINNWSCKACGGTGRLSDDDKKPEKA